MGSPKIMFWNPMEAFEAFCQLDGLRRHTD
jgi:hypothetical protein